jgi:hypothetical protein
LILTAAPPQFKKRAFGRAKPVAANFSDRCVNLSVESVRILLDRVPGATFSKRQPSELAILFENPLRRRVACIWLVRTLARR